MTSSTSSQPPSTKTPSLKSPSSKSPCPNKEKCGSCSWSHIPYPAQLQQKLSDINGSFKKNNLLYKCDTIHPAPVTEHYRNRMDFAINYKGLVGLREKGKWWSIIDDHHCFISDKRIEELFSVSREWTKLAKLSFFDRKAHVGLLRYALIRVATTGESLLNIITSKPKDETEELQIKEQLSVLYSMTNSNPTSLVWGIVHSVSDVSRGDENIAIAGDPWITEKINNYNYRINPTDFFQTNSRAAELLQTKVMDFVKETTPNICLDLYCGSGFFTIPLADIVPKPIGVELVPEAIETAKINAQLNKKNVEFFTSKTEEYNWTTLNPDTIIIDPPRAGLHDKVISDIKKNPPQNIVYVSCNYKALARELGILHDLYDVQKIEAIDMFPHTPHVEVVSLLSRK